MSEKRLSKKVALITGSSRGIGASIAKRLAREGARVVVNYNKNQASAEEVVRSIKTFEGEAIALKADVTDLAQLKRLVSDTAERFGTIDIMVNNAGIYAISPCLEVTPELYEKFFAL